MHVCTGTRCYYKAGCAKQTDDVRVTVYAKKAVRTLLYACNATCVALQCSPILTHLTRNLLFLLWQEPTSMKSLY